MLGWNRFPSPHDVPHAVEDKSSCYECLLLMCVMNATISSMMTRMVADTHLNKTFCKQAGLNAVIEMFLFFEDGTQHAQRPVCKHCQVQTKRENAARNTHAHTHTHIRTTHRHTHTWTHTRT